MFLNFKSWDDYHHQIYRIYHGIIGLSLAPFFLLFLELEVAEISESRVSGTWVLFFLFLLIPLCTYLSWFVWKSNFLKYQAFDQLREKLIEFRNVEIKKYLILEGVCILALVGLWSTAHYFFILAYFAVLVQFSFLRPSEDRIIRVMRLTKEERKLLHAENL